MSKLVLKGLRLHTGNFARINRKDIEIDHLEFSMECKAFLKGTHKRAKTMQIFKTEGCAVDCGDVDFALFDQEYDLVLEEVCEMIKEEEAPPMLTEEVCEVAPELDIPMTTEEVECEPKPEV